MSKSIHHHATCDHDFTSEENEFLIAIDRFKQRTGKKFPTFTETLGVLKSMGYYRRQEPSVSFDEVVSA